MVHATFALYVLALMAGAAALSQTLITWQIHRKAVIRWYGLFLLTLLLILLGFVVDLYAQLAGLSGERGTGHVLWMIQAAGGLTFVAVAPYFYHALLGVRMGRWRRTLFAGLDVLVVLAALAYLIRPQWAVAPAILIGTLFGMIAYGLLFIGLAIRGVGDPILRAALNIFCGLSILFFPLMLLDSLHSVLPGLKAVEFLDDLTQPLYFLILNALTIVFGLKYMNRPAYCQGDHLTEYFCSTFRITGREREIIELLIRGEEVGPIAARLFISAKTVENHIYNIYQKLGVRNRIQLFRLIRANALERNPSRP